MPDLSPEDLATLQTAALALVAAAFTALSILAIAAGRRALKYLSQLTGIKESDALQQLGDSAITAGIHYAEEFCNKKIRELGSARSVEGEEKRAIAKNVARSLAPAALASVSEDQLDMLVDAKVQSMRPFMGLSPTGTSVAPPAGTTYRASFPPAPQLPALKTPIPPRSRQ
jgi:hypothetical protein